MPSLQEIRQFNNRLTSMGNELEVVRDWGEEVEEVSVPDTGLDDDLSSLLSDTGELSDAFDDSDEEGPPDEAPPDFSALLADDEFAAFDAEPAAEESPLFDDLESGAGFEPGIEPDLEPPAGRVPPPDEGDFSDFAALLGGEGFGDEEFGEADETPGDESAAAETLDSDAPVAEWTDDGILDVGMPDEESSDDDLFAMADDLAPEELPDDDEFALPEGGFALADDGVPDAEEEPFEFPDEEPGSEAGAESDFGDLGGFEFSDDDAIGESVGSDDFSFEQPEIPGGDEDIGDVGDLDEIGTDDLDEFSLGDFGEEFGVLGEGPSDEDLNPAINVPDASSGIPETGAAVRAFHLSDDDFTRLQRHLAGLPLNVKQHAERIVAEAKGTTDEVEKLCRMLVAGAGAVEIATYAGKILGTSIRVPRGYEKRSGEQFEQERQSFAYQFRENVWPILRLAMVFLVAVGTLGLAGYHLVFRPLYARSLYVEGLELIDASQYSLANQTFGRAWEAWRRPDWYYDYAQAFIAERQYTLAAEKYDELLFGRDPAVRAQALAALDEGAYGAIINNHEIPGRGVLEYVDLESRILGNYERADRLVNLILFRDTNDYQGRLALGDNYMRWADEEPGRYEDARLSYARLIERYGQTDELLFRMLRYFIATDNLHEVVTIQEAFQTDRRARINPEIYAELAGYLIDNGLLGDVEDVIFRAMDIDRTIPELHYHLARYYGEVRAFGEEELALATARRLLADAQPFSPARRAMLIDTHTRIGENEYASGNYLDARESFTEAIRLYDQGRERRILGPDARLARAYARLGDIHYYVGRDYEVALAHFDRAEAAGFREPNLDYKQGYIHYRSARVDHALAEFRQAADDPAGLTNALLWATANTHFRRGNLFASEAYYRELIDRVERERDSIRTLLVDEDDRHRSMIEYMFRGYNNLGVVLYELSEQTGDPQKYSRSLVYFTRSTELSRNYQRDPATLVRSDAVDLGYLNQREALYPRPEYVMQIYIDIPEDLDDLVF